MYIYIYVYIYICKVYIPNNEVSCICFIMKESYILIYIIKETIYKNSSAN